MRNQITILLTILLLSAWIAPTFGQGTYLGGRRVSGGLQVDSNRDLALPNDLAVAGAVTVVGEVTADAYRGSGAYLTDLGEAATGPAVSDAGLVFAMNFESKNKNGATWLDSSDYNIHGTETGLLTVETGFNNGDALTGFSASNYITCGSPSTLLFNNVDFSVSAWVKTIQTDATLRHISGCYGNWGLCSLSGNLSFYYRSTVTSEIIKNSSVSISSGVWTHVAVSFTAAGGVVRFYVNGSLVNTTSVGETMTSSSPGAFAIGTRPSYSGRYFDGSIDDVRVWRGRILTDSDVNGLYLQRIESANAFVSQARLKVSSSGHLTQIASISGSSFIVRNGDGSTAGYNGLSIRAGKDDNTGTTSFISLEDGDGTEVGSITANGTGAVLLNVTSDRRMKEDETTTTLDGIALLKAVPMKDWRYKSRLGHVKIPVGDGTTYTLSADDGTTHSFAVNLDPTTSAPVMVLDGFPFVGTKAPINFYLSEQAGQKFITVPLDGDTYEVLGPLGTTMTLSLDDGPTMTFNGKTFSLDLGLPEEPLRTGFVAQDLEPYFPAAVGNQVHRQTVMLTDGTQRVIEKEYKTVAPMEIVPVLWEVCREQQEAIEALTARVTILESN